MGNVDFARVDIIEIFESLTEPNYLNNVATRFDHAAVVRIVEAAAPTLHCKDMVWVMGKTVGGSLAGVNKPSGIEELKNLFDYSPNRQPLAIGYLLGSEVLVDKDFKLVPADALILAALENKKVIKYRALRIDVLAD